jgi:hypothetical protein
MQVKEYNFTVGMIVLVIGMFLIFGSLYVCLDLTCNFLVKFYNHYCPSEESKMTSRGGSIAAVFSHQMPSSINL